MTLKKVIFVLVFALLCPLFTFAASEDEALINMERKMFENIKNKDLKAFGSMLTDDAVNVDPGNLSWDKAAIVQYLTALTLQEYNMSDVKVLWFDKNCAAVNYTFTGKAMMGDQAMPEGQIRVTTVWVKKGDQWLARFHQETPMMPPPKM